MKYKSDIIWNYVSLVIMAVVGLLMNTIVVLFYDADALGLFNETYAWYMILSQVSVWGIHMAIVKYVPETEIEKKKSEILGTSLLLVLMISMIVTSLSAIAVSRLHDEAWRMSMGIAFCGLIGMSLNKVLLNYLNAVNRMKLYAVFASVRYLALGVILLLLSIAHTERSLLSLTFPLTECVVLLSLILYFKVGIKERMIFQKELFKELFLFGTQILPSNIVLELNTKVDIVCLGFIVKDNTKIGIYSFAILFTEGFYMLYITIRKIVNPSIAEFNVKGKLVDKISEIRELAKKYLWIGGFAAYVGVSAFYYLYCVILNKPNYYVGVLYILIICFSMVVTGKYIVFGDLLAQIGMPTEESLLNLITVACNFALNIIFIMTFGTIGAAIATAVSHIVFAIYLKIRVKRRVGINL